MSRTADPLAVVGYDCRFASEEFARAVADVFAANGVRSLIFDRPSPTQVASWTVIDRKATGAAVITASHNPYLFNGVKYKPETGSSAPSEVIADLEQRINAVEEPRLPSTAAAGRADHRLRPAPVVLRADRAHGRPRRDQGSRAANRARVHVRIRLRVHRRPARRRAPRASPSCTTSATRFFGGINPEPIPPNIDAALAVMRVGGGNTSASAPTATRTGSGSSTRPAASSTSCRSSRC